MVCRAGYQAPNQLVVGFRNAEEGKLTFPNIGLYIPISEPSTRAALEFLKGISDPVFYLHSFLEQHGNG